MAYGGLVSIVTRVSGSMLFSYLCAEFFGDSKAFLIVNSVHDNKGVDGTCPLGVEPRVVDIFLIFHAYCIVNVQTVSVFALFRVTMG